MTVAEELRFARICREELSREKERVGIGLLEEKRLHSIFKRWICDDFGAHEQKVPGRGEKNANSWQTFSRRTARSSRSRRAIFTP